MNADGDKIHPFFRKTADTHEHQTPKAEEERELGPEDNEALIEPEKPAARSRRKRKSDESTQPKVKGKRQKTLTETVDPKHESNYNSIETPTGPDNAGSASNPPANLLHDAAPSLDSNPKRPQRKRRHPSSQQMMNMTSDAPMEEHGLPMPSSPRVVIPASSPPPEPLPAVEEMQPKPPKTPPKKVLRLNANGKFSSPVTKKADAVDNRQTSPEPSRKRGRPRRSKNETSTRKQLVVKVRYGGKDEAERVAMGQRIDLILSGEQRAQSEQVVLTPKKLTPKKPRTPKKSNKPTHPFFLGKPKDDPPKHESPRKASATTPGKLRRQVFGEPALSSAPEVPYAIGSALLKDRMMVKHPGAKEPPWPDRVQAHVRGLEDVPTPTPAIEDVHASRKGRKGKAAQLPFPSQESLLRSVASSLQPEVDCIERADGFYEPHPSLRLPEKLLMSGLEIQQQVTSELSVDMSEDEKDNSLPPVSAQLPSRSGLKKLWQSLTNVTPAQDALRDESLPWVQKYAPMMAADVLQPAREMSVLREWLTSLTISAVESSVKQVAKPSVAQESKPKKKKKRRKPDDLDDFLVGSDDEIHAMEGLNDAGVSIELADSKIQRSTVQVAAEGAKLSNAVLLSGPHGCGKTAAAYAVAKELEFRVFDISSHERRSGKDVIDKVGDMTENHLVKHHGTADAGELSANEDTNKERLDEAFQRDLASGRQGKMSGFFKPKGDSAPKPPIAPNKSKGNNKATTFEAVQKALKKPPKDQQQSLILLEEVDVLFKEDKDFWSTVLKLIISSKRPFIMTCNDEDLVPLQAMSLHAILRFTPPPLDLSADLLLLIAAAEGHLLKRKAVHALLDAKDQDLRASLMELDFWCQMGIGDPRGGLSWLYQRWPPGSDVDAQGHKLRVVSNHTYQEGMGLAPQMGVTEEDQLLWAWREHGIEPFALPGRELSHLERCTQLSSPPTEKRTFNVLKSLDFFADVRSSLDVFTRPGLSETAPLDTSLPEMSEKARHQYIEGMPLLQADEAIDYSGLSMEMSVEIACTMAKASQALSPDEKQFESFSPNLETLSPALRGSCPRQSPDCLTRQNFGCFDPISASDDSNLSNGLTQSIFDGPLEPIVTDLAPYVRSIVQYDLTLEEQRQRLSSVFADGEGGGRAKRARTTRAARSALEGSQRATTRRERWFTKALDLQAVLETAGKDWPKTSMEVPAAEGEDGEGLQSLPASSGESH
ncbi:P-loop containing nucleoside triphosphate hydrolase protein [Hortaea werneckii]|nr:P-loop containing nucleoside triphosphate hydrolase protein [Hortaea werneckii]KAI7096420.1 P-loop containing nucleoside triphosphate hydrolase protein [Hortaea werneckii]KAI7216948.1 P-loop containing nucleoside triphosphate hydrolase protein [Hortaea werneckii]KAI7310695.1 P-loop containing nucleoside triphosphate hydrolase protein [Hortaea werneckii]